MPDGERAIGPLVTWIVAVHSGSLLQLLVYNCNNGRWTDSVRLDKSGLLILLLRDGNMPSSPPPPPAAAVVAAHYLPPSGCAIEILV